MRSTVPSRLLLFDIDGTLINSFGSMRLYDKVIGEEAGVEGPVPDGEFHGSTDLKIVSTKLTAMGVSPGPDIVGRIILRIEGELETLVESGSTTSPKFGVVELLDKLNNDPHFTVSVLTGNTVRNAQSKLRAAGIDHYFDFSIGAFGSDSSERNDLVPVARRRFMERHAHELDGEAVIVIGDTARDLECARAGGARCILVSTGAYGHQELSSLGAELTVSDLSDIDAVLEFFYA